MYGLKQKVIFGAVIVIACFGLPAQGQVTTIVNPTIWHSNPVDNERMNNRIAEAAEQYKANAPIPRVALYDIGYPHSATEFSQLNGYGILLISSLSQTASELPLKRVYVSTNGERYDLKLLKEVRMKQVSPESQVAKTLGLYRVDALYLFPVFLRFQPADILIDFASNRDGMRIAAFDGTTPPNLSVLPKTKPVEGKLVDDEIKRFIKREYPGYSDK
jgi:hypothetical protein